MTDPATWERIETLLDELLELAPEERRARLDRLSGSDADLRPRIERLLAADSETVGGILDRGIATVAGRVMDDDDDGSPPLATPTGKRIGPFRVVRELGHGGMGEVLLAERSEGDFEQLVALKIIRQGLDRAEIVERFRHERRILARLRHPNIAALYDGGATQDGAPYFAMEYVRGTRIHEYCDENRLTIDQRIDLFDAVCRAVQHAHQNLVVHRDLKPGNVLVTENGTVKLLDFGIAKVLEQEGDAAERTQAGGFLTPAYAAPEQISGDPTSTATDVYALGVLLYVLLTGHHPHGDTSRSFELARAVLERDTPDPSKMAGKDTPTDTGEEVARRRRTAPTQLRRKIRGDLDSILRKTLQKKPEERYASAEDLRADLERHRRSLPVTARSATAGYRISRFARRHRAGVVTGSLVAVTLLSGIAGVVWQSREAARQRDQAHAVKEYLIGMFSAADPQYESGESLSALDIVERGAKSVSKRFDAEPEIRAEITQILGTVMSRLAQYDHADSLLRSALEDHRRLGDVNRQAETLVEIGDVARWQGRLDDAKARASEALDLLRGYARRDEQLVAFALSLRGSASIEKAQYDEATEALREALEISRAEGAGDSEIAAGYMEALASAHGYVGENDTSVQLLRDAIAIYLRERNDVAAARAMATLGDVLDEADRIDESEEVLRESVRILRREYGEEGHPNLGVGLANLGGMYRRQNRLAEAEPLQRESVEVFRRHLGDDHYFVARALNNLSLTIARKGDIEESVELLTQAIATIRRGLGDRHPALASPLTNLGNKLAELGRTDESERALREALAIYEESLGPTSHHTAYALNGLAGVLRRTGRLQESEALARRSYGIRRDALGAAHSQTVWARRELAQALALLDRRDEAVETMNAAIADGREGLPSTRRELARALLERALLGDELGEPASAVEPLLREALEIRVELTGEDAPGVEEVRNALERILGEA